MVPGGDSLGVACDTGRFTRYAAKTAGHVWGVDVSEGMLEKAGRYTRREGIENVTFARWTPGTFTSGATSSTAWPVAGRFIPFPTFGDRLARYTAFAPGGRFAGATLREELRQLLLDAGLGAVEFEQRGGALFFGASAEGESATRRCVLGHPRRR